MKCSTCKGLGTIKVFVKSEGYGTRSSITCPDCGGSGRS